MHEPDSNINWQHRSVETTESLVDYWHEHSTTVNQPPLSPCLARQSPLGMKRTFQTGYVTSWCIKLHHMIWHDMIWWYHIIEYHIHHPYPLLFLFPTISKATRQPCSTQLLNVRETAGYANASGEGQQICEGLEPPSVLLGVLGILEMWWTHVRTLWISAVEICWTCYNMLQTFMENQDETLAPCFDTIGLWSFQLFIDVHCTFLPEMLKGHERSTPCRTTTQCNSIVSE